jgi:DNA invertase Pin-like site-specific DNA recombinase
VRLSERVLAGLERARALGRIGGRPKAEDDFKLVAEVTRLRNGGASLRIIAERTGAAVNTVRKLLAA